MSHLQPEQAAFLLGMTLPTLKREHATTKTVIEAIPLDKGDYRPEPVAKSALELAWHIVAAEHRFLGGVADGAFDFTPNHRPDTVRNSDDIAKWYAASFGKNIARLEAMSGEDLAKIIDFRGLMQVPAVVYLTFSNNHSIHHRGQLSVYLRPMGAKVPAIYGESYDSAAAKKAAGG
ncbi:MAG: DinB family protein [Candidatus Acidiferrum sp.]|jgi:uncharacterized damage-inducible protein DinB